MSNTSVPMPGTPEWNELMDALGGFARPRDLSAPRTIRVKRTTSTVNVPVESTGSKIWRIAKKVLKVVGISVGFVGLTFASCYVGLYIPYLIWVANGALWGILSYLLINWVLGAFVGLVVAVLNN